MAETPDKTCPLPRDGVVDRYFMEHRAKLLDVAAFLDRLDRAPGNETPGDSASGGEDFRVEAMQRAIKLLIDEKGERAKRILELFSDPTTDPIPAAPMKGATGACNRPE